MFWSVPSLSSLQNFQKKHIETPERIVLDEEPIIVDDESEYD